MDEVVWRNVDENGDLSMSLQRYIFFDAVSFYFAGIVFTLYLKKGVYFLSYDDDNVFVEIDKE